MKPIKSIRILLANSLIEWRLTPRHKKLLLILAWATIITLAALGFFSPSDNTDSAFSD